jgi:hypothetical protein
VIAPEDGVELISLPLPLAIPDSYGVMLDTVNWGMLNTQWQAAGEDLIGRAAGSSGPGERLLGAAGVAAALVPGIADIQVGRQAQSAFGIVRNPHTTTIFNGVNARSHQFAFRLSPKNANEAQTMMNIIATIRNNMLPEESFGGFALDYPYLVKMDFTGIDGTITPVYFSFISDIRVDYTGGGGASFYKDGKPVDVTLTISLRELNIVTRNTFTGAATSGESIDDTLRQAQRDRNTIQSEEGFG